ncbi:hypothetical protein K435DRAFT_912054, partial [Dendrothele bispora CBS 962.96]
DFGKFASYYILGEYYFDVHPPFAKLYSGSLAGSRASKVLSTVPVVYAIMKTIISAFSAAIILFVRCPQPFTLTLKGSS